MTPPDKSCPECQTDSWENRSRTLSQIERDSGCQSAWRCKKCEHEQVEHRTEGFVSRESFSPIDHLQQV